jgi:gamma-glutamylcyclotransferase (GGCT)/AIG2-like uncharacterized protein YtfP
VFSASHLATRSPSSIRSVFVYGTLMPGGSNVHVAERGGPFTVREAYVQGFVLYHLEPEGYPAMVPGEGRVHGVLLDYDPSDIGAALVHLDALEGVAEEPPYYRRAIVEALPMLEPVWTYLYARPQRLKQPGAQRIFTGRWQARGPFRGL